jgi:hypothetical protein
MVVLPNRQHLGLYAAMDEEMEERPHGDPITQLMWWLGLIGLFFGVVAGTPMLYSAWVQAGAACQTPNPSAGSSIQPIPPRPGAPPAVMGDTGCPPIRSKNASSKTNPTGLVGGRGAGTGAGQGNSVVAGQAAGAPPGGTMPAPAIGAPPMFGMYRPTALGSQQAAGDPSGMQMFFAAATIPPVSTTTPGSLNPPMQQAYISQTETGRIVSSLVLPSGLDPTSTSYINNVMNAETSASGHSRSSTGIAYIDAIMDNTSGNIGPAQSTRSGQSGAGAGGAASLTNGTNLGTSASNPAQPSTNLAPSSTSVQSKQPGQTSSSGH